MKGYYSLIQFCPDRSRLEAANIGIVLVCPDRLFADVKISSSNDRVRRFFRSESLDLEGLEAAKDAIRSRVRGSADRLFEKGLADEFASSRGNDLILTPFRTVRVDQPQQSLEALFKELVGGRVRRPATRGRFRQLDEALRTPEFYGKIRFNQKVLVPIVGKRIVAPYAYQNGALNLIKPEAFDNQGATSAAMRLAVEGDLLRRHPIDDGREARLVVVSDFAGADPEVRPRVVGLLDEYRVKHVDITNVDQLVREISATAHD